jgi:hypothetical protein
MGFERGRASRKEKEVRRKEEEREKSISLNEVRKIMSHLVYRKAYSEPDVLGHFRIGYVGERLISAPALDVFRHFR